MRVLNNAIFIEANPANFSNAVRKLASIKYIVIHYTGNKGDTARNNALYFHEAKIESSAHFFVSGTSIYQSVQLNHAAWAVGLGSRKEPYFKYPEMWKKITNNNSVSIEICGYPNSLEGDEQTKLTAAYLAVDLMEKLNLTPACLYRHYDVTGKVCPAWAVNEPVKWLDFKLIVNSIFYGEEDDELKNTPENYSVFKQFMDKYLAELAETPADWEAGEMAKAQAKGLMDGTRPKSSVTRGELATVLNRLAK